MIVYSLPIGEVIEGSLLVDDPFSSFLGADPYALDIVRTLSQLLELGVDGMGSFDSSLRVELGRVRDFEEDIFHNVRGVWDLEFKRFSLKDDSILGKKSGLSGLTWKRTS